MLKMNGNLPGHGRLEKMFVQSTEKHLFHGDVVTVVNGRTPMVYPNYDSKMIQT